MLLRQEIFDDVAKALDADPQLVKCNPGAAAHRTAMQIVSVQPRREKRRRPAFFISFQAGSGSRAMKPSAIERQRRSATRRSWTGSGPKPELTRSHSSSTRSIQKRRPAFLARALTVARAGLADNGDS